MSPVDEAPPPVPTPKVEAPAILDTAVVASKKQEKPSNKRKSPSDEVVQVRGIWGFRVHYDN